MTVVTPLPSAEAQHPFYLRLAEGGDAATECLSKVNAFVRVAEPFADLIIAGPFQNYTMHNRFHARKLLHLMEYVVPSDVVRSLNALECLPNVKMGSGQANYPIAIKEMYKYGAFLGK
jgi:hypothetical protein